MKKIMIFIQIRIKNNTWLQKSCSSNLYDYLIIYLHKRKTNNNHELLDFCNLLPSKVLSSYNYTKHKSSIKECIKKIRLLKIFSFCFCYY